MDKWTNQRRVVGTCLALLIFGWIPVFSGHLWAQPARLPQLAEGVLITIPATPEDAETVTGPRELRRLSEGAPDWTPHFLPPNETLASLTKRTMFRRAVYQLEFSFKPVRLLTLDQPDGSTRRIWYLLYQVKNTGGYLQPVAEPDAFGNDQFRAATGKRTERFFPLMLLRAHEFDRVYPDQVLPSVVRRIHAIEIRDPQVPLYDSVSITQVKIRPSSDAEDRGVWGVALWPDVDRRTDFFSVYVQGLSNAYRWSDEELTYKTLQLNFWRPGDAVFEAEAEFRYGVPGLTDNRPQSLKLYGITEPRANRWIYLP